MEIGRKITSCGCRVLWYGGPLGMPAKSGSLAEGGGSGDIHGGRHGTIGSIPLPAPWLLVVSHPRLRGGKSELQLLFPSHFYGIPRHPFHYPMGNA